MCAVPVNLVCAVHVTIPPVNLVGGAVLVTIPAMNSPALQGLVTLPKGHERGLDISPGSLARNLKNDC